MARKTQGFTRKKILTLLLVCALILLLFFTAKSVFVKDEAPDLNTIEGREAYLKSLGWDIDRDSESFRSVVVPQKLEGIMAQYNKIQLKQGFDLNKHLGESEPQRGVGKPESGAQPQSHGRVMDSTQCIKRQAQQ